MKKIALVLTALIVFVSEATENNVIYKSSEFRDGQESFFLLGTQAGSYTLKSWQLETQSAEWDGVGEPKLSVGGAIQKAYDYHEVLSSAFGVQSAELRPAFSKQGSVVWFYLVKLTPLPYKPFSDKSESVVLLSGEILLPHTLESKL